MSGQSTLSHPRTRKTISIVVPVYNEEENIVPLYKEVCRVFEGLPQYSFEIVFSDNSSTDSSFSILTQLASDKRVKVIGLSRNFGYQRSIYTAYTYATGDAAIQLDCDLQDPPSLIPALLEKWEEGFAVVYGVRRTRQEGRAITAIRKLFYRLIDFLSEDRLPRDAGDFRLMDRRILEELKHMSDTYLRGSIATLGFKQYGIPYDRSGRERGTSKFGLVNLTKLAIDGILNHSIVPLRLASFTALIVSISMIIGIIGYTVARTVFGWNWPPGFATTTILILSSILLNAVFLGIIGEYVGRIYKELRTRRGAIVAQTINTERL